VDITANAKRLKAYATGYRRVLGLLTAPLQRRAEVQGLRDADQVLVFKREDQVLLRSLGVRTRVEVIDPWIDEPPRAPSAPATPTALFTGAMWRRENADGAMWFLEHVWPEVRTKVRDARLVLAGAGPSVDLQARADGAGNVEVTGEVADLLPYYLQASVFVAPIFVGGGLKFKVAQAMRCGLPVIGTPNAVQGVAEHAPEDALWAVTDDPHEMAQEVVKAFADPDAAARVGAVAAAWARERWSFERSLQRVRDQYEYLATRQ
jgi:glycosyltransferase involved in cell wall biosynthesis